MSTVVVATVKSNSSSPPTFQNTSGTEIGTLCRAWVNFNGTSTVAIRANFNVSSITDNGTGDYTVNFTTAMPDANYCFIGTASDDNDDSVGPVAVGAKATTYVPTTAGRRFETAFNGTNYDTLWCSIAIFR